ARQPDRRLPVAQQRQDRRGQVQAATTAATSLAYDFFRFLKRPLLEHQHNKDEITRLRQALAQEQARNMELAASVKKFRTSMDSMFSLADNNPL
ncbi:hypothetical protein RCH46_28225, partial [Serratia fonticola]|uniref:hypothetical protein n=1 Tax=Serratia fonticola TaxID=47917 RepID=UPI0027E5DC12